MTSDHHNSLSEVIDASRGIMSLSQSDITPTPANMYGHQTSTRTSSPESYGFPSAHSSHSSISEGSGVHSSYASSSIGDYSLSDYSSASESTDLSQRTLPSPSGLMTSNAPPPAQSMMGQFSSKMSSSTQKKHKCKICDKRFTRPSSLQTHIYSHTGEKRKYFEVLSVKRKHGLTHNLAFACEVEGCGRHFSVVSNLRRHRKVHKKDRTDRDGDST